MSPSARPRSASGRPPVHVVGGGLAGLVAAVTAATAGAPVVLHERAARPGGRALGGDTPYELDLGPHVVMTDGALVTWLDRHGLRPRLARPAVHRSVIVDDRGPRRLPAPMLVARGLLALGDEAPVDLDYRTWASQRFDPAMADELCRYAGLVTFHHDPGSLSARFVWDRTRRALARPDRSQTVVGGWGTLTAAIWRRAADLGVEVRLGDPFTRADLPDDGPVILATRLPTAGDLLGRSLAWPGARTALVDLALAGRDTRRPATMIDIGRDLRTCCFIERITAIDPHRAPRDVDLIQSQLGIADGTDLASAVDRIEQTMDRSVPGWRDHERWRRAVVVDGASGAVDRPGTTWRDRPAIDQGDGRYLAGDATAAPGSLSEVSVNSAVRATHLALARRERAAWAPGWPTVTLTAPARVDILTTATSNTVAAPRTARLDASLDEVWAVEPVAEESPHLSVRTRRFHTVVAGASADSDTTEVRVVVTTRLHDNAVVRAVLDRVAAFELRRHIRRPYRPRTR